MGCTPMVFTPYLAYHALITLHGLMATGLISTLHGSKAAGHGFMGRGLVSMLHGRCQEALSAVCTAQASRPCEHSAWLQGRMAASVEESSSV